MGAPETDAELVRRARAGSDAAFNQLVERHQQGVRAFLRRLLASGWAEADDLAQDVFLSAWRSLRSLQDPQGLRSWLLGIAWRKARDRMRSAQRSAARDRAWSDQPSAAPHISAEDGLAVREALADLPPEVRACAALCLAEGWSHAEAATALGLPLGTVKSHVLRGRARLLAALGGPDDGR